MIYAETSIFKKHSKRTIDLPNEIFNETVNSYQGTLIIHGWIQKQFRWFDNRQR